ncbi:protein cordon-bleu isoform X3 [Gouania willdenowi]|uniref:protein cordon-bleu isoform X3 n=1 Tax=Gouania willdenowi TaxID=441366 RepID=UPI001055D02A|nr:protein cordon-bleu isoform X3 [Gouania willdenowi]
MTESSKPPLGRRMKAHAPHPPKAPEPAPRHIFRNVPPDGEQTSGMDAKENILKPMVEFLLTLPHGYQISVIKDGSKALMDLLVELCSHHHLNPALHTLELLSPEGHSLGFKPNALLGALDVACILIKEKVLEDKVVRRPAPKVPEKSVRLMVNFNGSQKAVVRVNPLVPLQALIPVICDKCEFDPSHVLLLKDVVSRHELSLDKSLAELGIKELYVHNQKLDSIRSSTTSLGRPEKKGLFGIFQFSRRKSKTETTSQNMDNCADKITQNTDTQSNGLPTISGVSSIEDRTCALGQSHSVMNIPRMSPKAEAKKRRAPPPPPSAPTSIMGQDSFEASKMGSSSQLRKRKAPAPPPTPISISQGFDDASTSTTSTPDSISEMPPPLHLTKVAESTTFSEVTLITQTVKPAPLKVSVQPLSVGDAGSTSSSTPDSMARRDSSSELSHSLDDSDTDLDQAGSHCSTLTSSSVSGSVQVLSETKSSFTEVDKAASNVDTQMSQEVVSDSSSRSDTESTLNVRLNEVENNRHSAIGNTDRPVPPKPRRSPVRKPSYHDQPPTLSIPSSSLSLIKVAESNPPLNMMEGEEAAPQSWLHSMNNSVARDQQPEETASLGSSSSGSSLPDRGYAASEGMGEDSGIVSSPSETQTTSPDGSLSLHENSRGRQEEPLQPGRDSFSDSDEGCATWESIHRNPDINPQADTLRLKNGYEDDADLSAQFHQTMADFETDLQGHVHITSAKDSPYTMSTDSNEVPVSMVDMDVPVTAIDEVLEDLQRSEVEHEVKFLIQTKSAESKGPDCKNAPNVRPQNKNNNAHITAINSKKSNANTKSQSELDKKPLEKRLSEGKAKENTLETKHKKSNADADQNKDYKKNSTIKSTPDIQENNRNTVVVSDSVKVKSYQQKTPDISALSSRLALKKDEEEHKVDQNNSSYSISHSKITHNVQSRFGLRTFTVVPSKPACVHVATEESDVRITTGAIKIDDQGNMVTAGISRKKNADPLQSEDSFPLGKAKAFWSSNQKREVAVTHSQDPNDKTKEDTNTLKKASPAVVETNLKPCKMDHIKPFLGAELLKVETKDSTEDEKVTEENKKISVSKNFTQPSNKPVLPSPLLPDLKKDLSYLKTSRRTSSQYVASAINKYAPKTSGLSNIHDYSTSMKAETTGFPKSGRSMLVNPRQSSQSSSSDNKENVSMFTTRPPGPKRSISHPEYATESQRDLSEERQNSGRFDYLFVTETVKKTPTLTFGTPQMKVVASNKLDNTKSFHSRSPSPTRSNVLHVPTKPPTVPKPASQGHTKSLTPLALNEKLLTTGSASDNGVTLEPPSMTLFGPIAKFRPVIQKSIEKDTSLHSSLMEAINTGGGRERLKKVSTSDSRSLKNVDVENERSALLAAIRAHSTTSRLRKTKSEAADELQEFRRVTCDDRRTVGSFSPPSLTCTSPVFNPPPPPPAPMVGPPPPPPLVLPQAKLSSPVHPSANNPLNLAVAREAMLDAIRSGSAADRLKKVAAPRKTVQVNGRLGTIQQSIPPQ